MSARVTIDDRAFIEGLQRAARRIALRTEADILRLAITVQNEARAIAPVDTGRLRASIQAGDIEHDAHGAFVKVGTNVEYAGFVEFGTRYMAARPYLRPALLAALRKGLR